MEKVDAVQQRVLRDAVMQQFLTIDLCNSGDEEPGELIIISSDEEESGGAGGGCLLYTSPSPRDRG
eukprot:2296025-Rhodomonas_salina.4